MPTDLLEGLIQRRDRLVEEVRTTDEMIQHECKHIVDASKSSEADVLKAVGKSLETDQPVQRWSVYFHDDHLEVVWRVTEANRRVKDELKQRIETEILIDSPWRLAYPVGGSRGPIDSTFVVRLARRR